VVIAGVTIPAGEVVCPSLASASNDPAHLDEPERWDIHRAKPDDHFAPIAILPMRQTLPVRRDEG
jgi:cytochrome P450